MPASTSISARALPPDTCRPRATASTLSLQSWACGRASVLALLTTGFIVKEKARNPAHTAGKPVLYETGVQEDGNAFMTLAWEMPKGTEYRLAKAYEVFYKNAGADAYSYTSLGTVESLKQNFMRVTGLTPGATYDFAFKPLLPGGKDGGLSGR